MFAAGRNMYSLSRAGYYPKVLSLTGARKVPYVALLVSAVIGVVLVFGLGLIRDEPGESTTDAFVVVAGQLLNIAVFGAVISYFLQMVAFLVLTDRLVKEMSADEVEAVFGHEVGHIKHHHMLFYFAFLMASLVLIVGASTAVAAVVGQRPVQQFLREHLPALTAWVDSYRVLTAVPLLALLGSYTFLVFGFLSRRCERQADIYGCRAVSCGRPDCLGHDETTPLAPRGHTLCPTGIRTFINALDKVAMLNGISRDRPGWLQSWQHSTIARRVEFLQRMLLDPTVEPRFQRTVRRVKWGMILGLVAALAALAVVQEWKAIAAFVLLGG